MANLDRIIAIGVFIAFMLLLALASWYGYPNWTTE
jgi:hypothetical protein